MPAGVAANERHIVAISNPVYSETYVIPATPADMILRRFTESVIISSVVYTPTVVGSNGGAVTAIVRKATGTTAIASGTTLHASGSFDLKGTINTDQTAVLATSAATLTFAASDRLVLDVTGTTTDATGILTVTYQKV
jgi:hypothetical protein